MAQNDEKITLGEAEYVLPRLTVGVLRRNEQHYKTILEWGAKPPEPPLYYACTQLLLASLNRKYPGVTIDEIEENIAVGDCPVVIQKLLMTSGLPQRASSDPGGTSP